MFQHFIQVLIDSTKTIPTSTYVLMLAVLLVGFVVVLLCKKIHHKWRYVAGVMLVLYVFLIYCHTVIYRALDVSYGHNFVPFWSYKPMLEGDVYLIVDGIVNVLMFVPVGVLYGAASRKSRAWKVLLVGACISVSIEALQFFLHRGFSEIDDVLHNALGCLIGWMLYRVVAWGVGRIVDPS